MFTFQNSFQFLPKLKPFLAAFLSHRSLSLKITNQRKPIKHKIPNLESRGRKASIKKESAEPKVFARERISKIYNILKYSPWDSAQEQLENLPIRWDSFTVNQVLKAHPPMEKAWLFFNWASGRKSFRHDQYTYTTMLDIFGEARRIQSMMHVFEQMKTKGIKVDVVTYTALMHWVSNDGDVHRAIELWKEMRANGCRPTVVTYTAYMKILFHHKKVNEASDVYREMLESGVSPNCHTYTVLMDYLASSGKSAEALEVFSKMQDAGVQPDKAACNILIEIFCRTGEIWAIIKVLEYMKENFLVLRYTIYQKALEAFNIVGESDVLLRHVNQHLSVKHLDDCTAGYDPGNDIDKENCVVWHLLCKQNLVAIDTLLAETMEKGVQLGTNVLSSIVEVNCERGRKNAALFAYEYSVKLSISIDRTAHLALLGLSVRTNSFQIAVEVVKNVVKQGLSLGTYLNSSLIYRLGCCRQPVSAAKVFDLLPEEERSTAEYTALIGAYFSSGNAEKALETFKIMKSQGIHVALGTYCVLIAGLDKCGKVDEMVDYKKEKTLMQNQRCSGKASMEESICNLLFTMDFISNQT